MPFFVIVFSFTHRHRVLSVIKICFNFLCRLSCLFILIIGSFHQISYAALFYSISSLLKYMCDYLKMFHILLIW